MRSRWFVATDAVRVRRMGADIVVEPSSVAHGKQMGTRLTACGRSTDGLRKLWELRFEPLAMGACRACAEVVLASAGENRTARS